MFLKVEGVLDLYRNQNRVLYNRDLENSYQEFWNNIVNKNVPAAFEKMSSMVKNVELFTEKHWNKISNVADQKDEAPVNLDEIQDNVEELISRTPSEKRK